MKDATHKSDLSEQYLDFEGVINKELNCHSQMTALFQIKQSIGEEVREGQQLVPPQNSSLIRLVSKLMPLRYCGKG